MSRLARRVAATFVVSALGFALTVPFADAAFASHTVTSLAVPYIAQGQSRTITINGTGFSSSITLAVSVSPATNITVTNPTFVNSTTVTADVAVAAGAVLGARDVTVTETPAVDAATCTGCLHITSATGVSPTSPLLNTTDGLITVTGTGFNAGVAQVQVLYPGLSPLVATQVDVQNDTTLSATLPLTGAAPVRYVVQVTPTSGAPLFYGDTIVGGLQVNADPPTLASASPSSLGQGASNVTVHLTGTNLAKGATVTTSNGSITVGAVTWLDLQHLDVVLSASSGAATGPVTVTVTNADTQKADCIACLTVTAKPTVTSATPARGQGAQGATVTIAGTGFDANIPTLGLVTFSGTGVSIAGLTRDSDIQLTATVDIAPTATPGTRGVTVTNPDGGVGSCASCFTIDLAPTVTGISPPSASNTQSALAVHVSGTGFDNTGSGLNATLQRSGQADIALTTIHNVTSTAFDATVNLTTAAPGNWDVRVVNADAGVGTCVGCFGISANQATITRITPNTLGRGANGVSLAVVGTNFASGDVVTFGTGVTSSGSVVVTDSTHLTVSVDVAADAPLGFVSAQVDHPSTGQPGVSCVNCLSISGAPVPTAVSAGIAQGTSNATRTITGTGFQDGDTVAISGTGVTLNGSPVFVDASHLTINISATVGAPATARDVTVTNPADHGSATLVGGLLVSAQPTFAVAPITPSTRGQGAQGQVVTLHGTGFQTGATVAFSGTKVDVVGQPVMSSAGTILTVTINVASDAALGARDVTVTNPDDGTATSAGAFTVTAAPTVSTLAPSTRAQSSIGAIIVTGTGFHAGITKDDVSFSGTGVTVTALTRDSATQLTLQVTVSPGVATGGRSFTVTNNDDGGTVTKASALTITSGMTISAVTPNNGIVGTSFPMTIDGSGFAAGTTVSFSAAGASASSVTVVSATRIQLNVSLNPGTTSGAGTVTLTRSGISASGPFTAIAADQVQRFVTSAYQDVLGRLPDRGGFDYWVGVIRTGTPRSTIADALYGSLEVRRNIISFLYALHLHRVPDEGGLQYFADQLLSRTIESIQIEFTASPEYFSSRGGNNIDQFITAVYNDVLARNPDPGGLSFWHDQLASGQPRSVVASGIIFSDEAVGILVDSGYRQLLGRGTDPGGRAYWIQQIQTGLRLEHFLALLIGSNEYFGQV